MTGPIDNTSELRNLIRVLVKYQVRAGRQVTFVWPAKNDLAHRTIIYALHPIKPEFETNEPVLQAKGRHIFFAWLAAGWVMQVTNPLMPNWGPVFRLTQRAGLTVITNPGQVT